MEVINPLFEKTEAQASPQISCFNDFETQLFRYDAISREKKWRAFVLAFLKVKPIYQHKKFYLFHEIPRALKKELHIKENEQHNIDGLLITHSNEIH